MDRQAAHTYRRRWPGGALALAAAILAACALAVTPAAASARAPLIGPLSASAGFYGEGLIETQINPEGHETTYEILADCEVAAFCQHTEGKFPADNEEHPISLKLTGLKPGITYRFDAYATSSAGAMNWPGEFTAPVIPPGACPEGCSTNERYEAPPISKASLESAEHQAAINFAKAEAERSQAKEQEEQKKATENAARYATEEAELKQAEEREAQEAEHPACIVPALKGDTLKAARRALTRAHCRLGAVHWPAHHHGTLYVSAQGIHVGERLAGGARVTLTLGAKGSGAKRASRR